MREDQEIRMRCIEAAAVFVQVFKRGELDEKGLVDIAEVFAEFVVEEEEEDDE